MYVNTELHPHLILLIIFLTFSWSFATWLFWQNKKLHCELLPQHYTLSKYGLIIGTVIMILDLWILSLFYDELMFSMTIIFGLIMIGLGTYLAKYFEQAIFIQHHKDDYWKTKLRSYFFKNYGNGLGPRSTQKVLQSMIPNWWIKLLPIPLHLEINDTLKRISKESEEYAFKREKVR